MLSSNILDLRDVILNNNFNSVKNYLDYECTLNLFDVCKKLFIDCLYNYSIDAVQVKSTRIDSIFNPREKIRYKIADLLIESSGINLNDNIDFVYNGQKYKSSPFEIALHHMDIDIIHFLLSHPRFQVNIFHLNELQAKIGTYYADHINFSLTDLTRLCEIKLLETFIHNRKKNPAKQNGLINKFFGGIDKDFKISAAEFLLTNIKNILLIESYPEYNVHKTALNQGHSESGLHAIFKAIIEVEIEITKWEMHCKNPNNDDEQKIELVSLIKLNNNVNIGIIKNFHKAIISNQLEEVKRLLHDFPELLNSLNTCNKINPCSTHINYPRVTPLHLAVINNHVEIICYLLAFPNINFNAKAYFCHRDPKINVTPLSYAIENSIINAIEPLLEKNNIEVSCSDFRSLFNILRETKNRNNIGKMINLVYICEIKLVESRINVLKNVDKQDSTFGKLFGVCKSKKIEALNFILTNLEFNGAMLSIKDTAYYPKVKEALNEGKTKEIFDSICTAEMYIEELKNSLQIKNFRNSCIMDKYR